MFSFTWSEFNGLSSTWEIAPFFPSATPAQRQGVGVWKLRLPSRERCWHRALREEASCQNSPNPQPEGANLRGHRTDHLSAKAQKNTEGCKRDTKLMYVSISVTGLILLSSRWPYSLGLESTQYFTQWNTCWAAKGKATKMTKQNPYEANCTKQLPYSSLSRFQRRPLVWLL